MVLLGHPVLNAAYYCKQKIPEDTATLKFLTSVSYELHVVKVEQCRARCDKMVSIDEDRTLIAASVSKFDIKVLS